MNAPIFFMNMISPLQKIITIQILVHIRPSQIIRPSLIISIVHNPFAMILHQEIVLEHDFIILSGHFRVTCGQARSVVFPRGHFWSPVVTCGHFRSPKRGFLMNQNMTQKDSFTVDPLTQ